MEEFSQSRNQRGLLSGRPAMGFRINNNVSALIAQGNLQKNQQTLNTSIERLSSGLRINRGADDAAGLTISEKLRGQIKGLNRAILNAQDGISLIQTAEGALNEDASILNRIRELTIQASSDTLTTNDRQEIQREVDQLVDEMDRIAQTTEFNTKKLLDGSATALVSVNSEGMEGIQVDSTTGSSGDYLVEINLAARGERQQLASNILVDQDDGELVDLDTKIGEIESFFNNEGNSVLSTPQELTIRGNTNATKITLSADVSVQELVSQLKTSITKSPRDGGLGIRGTDVSFNRSTGQILFTSGSEGRIGDISFAADENLIKAFGFEETVPSQDPAYRATATQQGVADPIISQSSTTNTRFSGVIPGIDLEFEPATPATIDGTESPEEVVRIGSTDASFTFADTNAYTVTATGEGEPTPSDPVTITLKANTTYSKASIENIINTSIGLGRDIGGNTSLLLGGNPDGVWTPPNVRASFRGNNLVLTSGLTGSSAKISIYNASSSVSNILGVQNGVFMGSQGEVARLEGAKDLSNGFSVGANSLIFQVEGPDGRKTDSNNTANRIEFNANSNISPVSIVQVINNSMRAANIMAEAKLNNSGQLSIESLEDGEDTSLKISLVSALPPNQDGNLSDIGMVDGGTAVGKGGVPAEFTGATNEAFADRGYIFDTTVRFEIIDRFGASSGDIVLAAATQTVGTNNVQVATDVNQAVSSTSIAQIIDSSGLNSTDITYSFDSGGRLQFHSKSVGDESRILLTSKDPRFGIGVEPVNFTASTSQTSLFSSFGIDGTQAAQGVGKTEYAVHVSDRSFSLQIGANESQTLESSIANFSARALGLKGIDVTSFASAVKALGSVDRAVRRVSSERSKLGSLQNRLTSTINNLTVTTNNLQAAESRIRDVDIAVETVSFTRTQILIQAGTAQLAQANALPQQALQLLGG